MVYPEEVYPDYILREKMKKWGILKEDETSDIIISALLPSRRFGRFLRSEAIEAIDVMAEIRDLRSRVRDLERRVGGKREFTDADYVYELFKEELEKKHFGRIVAIDTESKKIVGIGDTILEAYNDAKEKTGKDQFDFRRVGYKYIHKV